MVKGGEKLGGLMVKQIIMVQKYKHAARLERRVKMYSGKKSVI